MSSDAQDTFDMLREANRRLDNIYAKFLTDRGWTYSCGFPDCRWRWSKEIDGITYAMRPEDAVDLEDAIPMKESEVSDA